MQNNLHDLAYLEYGPVSVEHFKDIWTDNVPKKWVAALKNITYFPPAFMTDDYLDTLLGFFSDNLPRALATDFDEFQTERWAFIEGLVRHPNTPRHILQEILQEWSFIVSNPEASSEALGLYFNPPGSFFYTLDAAYHKNADIRMVASYLYENYDLIQDTAESEELRNVTANCDNYLSALGWDEEVLASMPLSWKLGVIRS